MRIADARSPIALGLALLLAQLPAAGAGLPLGKLSPGSGVSALNGTELGLETTVYARDRVTTDKGSSAWLFCSQGNKVHFGPETAAVLGEEDNRLVIQLEHGQTVAQSSAGRRIVVSARGLRVEPTGASTYRVTVNGSSVVVAAERGLVIAQGGERSLQIPANTAVRFETAAEATGPGAAAGLTGGEKLAIGLVVAGAIAAAIAVPLALQGDEEVSPSRP